MGDGAGSDDAHGRSASPAGDATATGRLSAYMVGAPGAPLPPEVAERAKHHILDTLAAMVSGTALPVGGAALRYARLQGDGTEATVAGLPGRANVVVASLVNGMLAHADETDDSHAAAGMHPGCAIVPAALAMAERNGRSGLALLRAVVLGYDVGARLMRAVGADLTKDPRPFDTHAVGGTFGAAAAAGAVSASPFHALQARYLLSFAAQQASGLASYPMDADHVEKAFVFGGMPARNGVTAATMIEAGFTGIEDDLEGHNGFLASFEVNGQDPEALTADLGQRFEIMNTNIKKYAVGSPIQAPVDCLERIVRLHGVGPDDLAEMIVHTPKGEDRITRRDQRMSNLNVRYLLAATLRDGRLTFAAAHDEERVTAPELTDLMERMSIRADPSLATAESPRQGRVAFVTHDGRTLTEHVVKVRGVMEDPMSTDEVVSKARELLEVALRPSEADELIEHVLDLEALSSVADLTALLRPA